MNRSDFKAIASLRIADAEALLAAGRWSGAYYMAGYGIECALKSIICKKLLSEELPAKGWVDRIYTHNLQTLLDLSELDLNDAKASYPRLERYWNIVKAWSEQSRYQTVTEATARNMIEAATDANAGVITWLRNEW